MTGKCRRGHAMVGDNVMVYGVAKQTRCRTCYEDARPDRAASKRAARQAAGSQRQPQRLPLDPAIVTDLRRRAGIDGPPG